MRQQAIKKGNSFLRALKFLIVRNHTAASFHDFDDATPPSIAGDLPVHNEIIHGLSKKKRWAHNKNARAEFLLGALMIKHWEHLRIVILVSEIVSYHDENINIIWLQFAVM